VPALELDEGISVVSRAWALQMSIVGDIAHNPNFKTLITGWSRIGENVGMGHPLSVVHQALVTSPAHYANIVEPAYTRIGIGVVDVGGGNVYVVQNFVRPRTLGSVPAPTAPPTTARRAPSTTVASRPAPTRSTAAPVTTHVPAAWAAQAAPAPSAAAAPGAGSRAQATSPVLTYVLAGLRAFDERLHR
jgi:hypothetical protein